MAPAVTDAVTIITPVNPEEDKHTSLDFSTSISTVGSTVIVLLVLRPHSSAVVWIHVLVNLLVVGASGEDCDGEIDTVLVNSLVVGASGEDCDGEIDTVDCTGSMFVSRKTKCRIVPTKLVWSNLLQEG